MIMTLCITSHIRIHTIKKTITKKAKQVCCGNEKICGNISILTTVRGIGTNKKNNKSTKWVYPCGAKVYNNLLWNWFPCNHQDKFLLDKDNPPCSKGRGHLYGTDMALMKHCRTEKDIRHKLILIYLERVFLFYLVLYLLKLQ